MDVNVLSGTRVQITLVVYCMCKRDVLTHVVRYLLNCHIQPINNGVYIIYCVPPYNGLDKLLSLRHSYLFLGYCS